MADFLNRMLGRNSGEEKGSGATAKDRLKMVLTHDRIQVSPEKLNEMRAEIISVIAKYVPEIDPDSVDISIEQTDRYNNRIVAQIPFTKSRNKAVVFSEENADLETAVEPDATTLPHVEDADKPKTVFIPDDKSAVLIDASAEAIESATEREDTKSKLVDADEGKETPATSVEAERDDAASDSPDSSGDSDSSED